MFLFAEHEFVEAVGSAFDAVNCIVPLVHFSTGQNSAIARTAEGSWGQEFGDCANSFFKFSGEEFVEGFELSQVLNFHFIKFNSI